MSIFRFLGQLRDRRGSPVALRCSSFLQLIQWDLHTLPEQMMLYPQPLLYWPPGTRSSAGQAQESSNGMFTRCSVLLGSFLCLYRRKISALICHTKGLLTLSYHFIILLLINFYMRQSLYTSILHYIFKIKMTLHEEKREKN